MNIRNIVLSIVFMFVTVTNLISATVKSTNSITYYDHQDVESWYTDSTNVLYVPQFNPAIGNLINVDVYVKMNITNSFGAENRSVFSGRPVDSPDFIGVIGVTNNTTLSFGNQTQYLNRTNFLFLDVYDGVTDFAGPSGGRATNIVVEVFKFNPQLVDVVGYKVWSATNSNSARAIMYFYGGSFVGSVRTTAGLDVWTVYTYVTEYNCPDCDKDKDKDCDKDKDKDKDRSRKNKK